MNIFNISTIKTALIFSSIFAVSFCKKTEKHTSEISLNSFKKFQKENDNWLNFLDDLNKEWVTEFEKENNELNMQENEEVIKNFDLKSLGFSKKRYKQLQDF